MNLIVSFYNRLATEREEVQRQREYISKMRADFKPDGRQEELIIDEGLAYSLSIKIIFHVIILKCRKEHSNFQETITAR